MKGNLKILRGLWALLFLVPFIDTSADENQAQRRVLQMPDLTPSPTKAIKKAFEKSKTEKTDSSKKGPSENFLYSPDCKSWSSKLPIDAVKAPVFFKRGREIGLLDTARRFMILSSKEKKPIVVETGDRAFWSVLGKSSLGYRAIKPGSVSPGLDGMLEMLVLLGADSQTGRWMIITKDQKLRLLWMIPRDQQDKSRVSATEVLCDEKGCDVRSRSSQIDRQNWNDLDAESKKSLVKKGLFAQGQRQSLREMCEVLDNPSLAGRLGEYEKRLKDSCGIGFIENISSPAEISSYCDKIKNKIVPLFESLDR